MGGIMEEGRQDSNNTKREDAKRRGNGSKKETLGGV